MADSLPTTVTGKAFEGAVLLEIQRQRDQRGLRTEVSSLPSTISAIESLAKTRESERNPYHEYAKAAHAAVEMLMRLEPVLAHAVEGKVYVQTDNAGQEGDVRDVLFADTTSKTVVGVSCKNNHADLKHQRISEKIDIGAKWFGQPSSQFYWEDIKAVFQEAQRLRKEYGTWDQIPNESVREELIKSANEVVGDEIERQMEVEGGPKRFAEFLVGTHDFYKFIKLDNQQLVIVQAYNLSGVLGKKYAGVEPLMRGNVAFPQELRRLTQVGGNRIHLCMDGGWQFGLRLHTASRKIETSLKFASSALGLPSSLVTAHCPY